MTHVLRRRDTRVATRPSVLSGAIAHVLHHRVPDRLRRHRAPTMQMLATVVLLGCSVMAPARADNWTGAVSSDWFDPANWSGGDVPSPGEMTVLDHVTPNPTMIRGRDVDAFAGQLLVGRFDRGRLIVTNGATLSSASSSIGDVFFSTGEVEVSEGGSKWTVDGDFIVGNQGRGNLDIRNGGVVSTSLTAGLGLVGDGSGRVRIDGPGSKWAHAGVLTVGGAGTGTLSVVNRGSLVGGDGGNGGGVIIGDASSGSGVVLLSGAGTNWSENFVTVGQSGLGSVSIYDGATAQASLVTVGANPGSEGDVRISGTGSSWIETVQTVIGLNGEGDLRIENGGRFETRGDAIVGDSAGSEGTAVVTGSGSLWGAPGGIVIGESSVGTLSVLDRGAVATSTAVFGNTAAGQGSGLISGFGSTWTNVAEVRVGNSGLGDLRIEAGGRLASNGNVFLAALAGSRGVVDVSGNGSRLEGLDAVVVGMEGDGVLTVGDGGAVSAGTGIFLGRLAGSSGTLNIGGAAGSPAAAPGSIEASGIVFGDGTGTINFKHTASSYLFAPVVSGVGTVNVLLGPTIFTGENTYTGNTNVIGTLQIGNGGASGSIVSNITNTGAVVFDRTGQLTYAGAITGSGRLRKRGGGTLTLTGDSSQGETIADAGLLRLQDGGSLATGILIIADSAADVAGVSVLDGGDLDVGTTLIVGNHGSGTLSAFDGGTVDTGNAIIGNSSGAQGRVVVNGEGSTLTAASSDPNQASLTVGEAGSGELTISNGGMVGIGNGSGVANLAFNAGSTGTLNIGAAAGATAVAAGTLDAATVAFGAGTGTINFNHTDGDYAFDTAISGAGTVNQWAGTTVLTGTSSYTGATHVEGGTLLVEGALGDTAADVSAGATLGGSGSIAGNVSVLDGGILAPGSSAGTLAVGSLFLSGGSILDYELGQAGVIGGGVNDLIEITGDLTLDGSLQVTDIGGFGAGVYRLMNYGGDLTDNGLEFGALPGGSDPPDLFLQTAIDGQVNLVNSAGLTLSFWDGAVATEHNNAAIDDGDGRWNADNDNWTAADGALNGRWDDGTFAVFGGASGTVDVVGEQAVAGMQFMSGYTLDAGAAGVLRIDGVESAVRVDPDVTATIAAPIVGAGGLVKTDTGTLVLSGANTYSGGTAIDMGTLVVSADNNLGDPAGALSFDGGTLRNTAAFATSRAVTLEAGGGTFETVADLTMAGTIDGDGALAKAGDGVLTLTGSNIYAGGTTVAAGTLSVSADANLGDAAGALTLAGGTLQTTAAFDSAREVVLAGGTLQNDADLGLSGTVFGGAALVKDGAGTLTLTGDNTYGGGTRVLEGTLVGDVDAIRGNLDNAGTVVFDQATDATFAGTIDGSGDMGKRGAGALTLGAASALDWSIDVGALAARAAQFTGDAAIADGATLRFTEAGGSYAGTLSGAGTFEIAGGTAVFALAGNSAGFGGTTSLESGTLRIDGILGGLTLVAAGAMLGGTGTLGNIDNAGTLAAGNSIGTLTLTGDYVHRDGATLLAEIEPGGDSDLLEIAGSATIAGGTVDVIKAPGQYAGGTRYTLIDAAGGVTGSFDTLEQDLPFLDLLLGYDANHVYLDVQRNDVGFDIVCGDGTFNQCQVAGALDRIADAPEVSSDLQATLAEVTTLDLPGAQAAFDSLSGEAHGSFTGILLDGDALYGQTVSRRIADRREAVGAEHLRGGAWVRAYGASSDLDGDGNAHAAGFEQRGLAVGFDAWSGEQWLIGASFNALQIDADFRPGDHGEADAKNASLYASVQGEHAYLDAVTSFAWWDNEITRAIVVGDIAREARSQYGGHRFSIHLEAGWTFALGQTQQLTPLASVEYAKLDQERFREEGAQDLDLIGRSQDVERATVSAGLRWTTAFERGDWTFEPMLRARWLHAFGDEHTEQDVAFAGAPDIGYRVRGVSWPQDRGLVGVGLQLRRGDNLDLFVDVDYQKGGGLEAQNLGAGVRWRW